jgi:hypothetical protein
MYSTCLGSRLTGSRLLLWHMGQTLISINFDWKSWSITSIPPLTSRSDIRLVQTTNKPGPTLIPVTLDTYPNIRRGKWIRDEKFVSEKFVSSCQCFRTMIRVHITCRELVTSFLHHSTLSWTWPQKAKPISRGSIFNSNSSTRSPHTGIEDFGIDKNLWPLATRSGTALDWSFSGWDWQLLLASLVSTTVICIMYDEMKTSCGQRVGRRNSRPGTRFGQTEAGFRLRFGLRVNRIFGSETEDESCSSLFLDS